MQASRFLKYILILNEEKLLLKYLPISIEYKFNAHHRIKY